MGTPRFAWNEIPLAEEIRRHPRASTCRSGRSTSRSCTRPRPSAWATRTRSSGSTTCTATTSAKLGPLLEHHPIFPERANISLAQVVSREHIVLRTWERGAGLTRACGSAACAAAVAAARLRRTGRKVTVTLPGGDLRIEWRERDDHVLMTGPGGVRIRRPLRSARCSPRTARWSVSVDVVTFGCRLNAYESEVIRRQAQAAGFATPSSSTPAR